MPADIAQDHLSPISAASARRLFKFIIITDLLIILFSTILGLMKTGNPSRYFGEGRFTMGISCAQLLTVGFFAFRTFQARRDSMSGRGIFSSRLVWLIVAFGFVFLAYDEAFEFHEHFDQFIQKSLGLKDTPLLDRIDDALIALYGVIGLTVLWCFMRELLLFRRAMTTPLVAGFICLFLSVAADTASNGDEFLFWLTGDMPTAQLMNVWLSVADGGFTILGEGFFIVGFYSAWLRARELAAQGRVADV